MGVTTVNFITIEAKRELLKASIYIYIMNMGAHDKKVTMVSDTSIHTHTHTYIYIYIYIYICLGQHIDKQIEN